MASDKMVNNTNSFSYSRFINNFKLLTILNMTGFTKGSLPFMYLGVPTFKGKAKVSYLRPIVDRIISKMFGWKGSNLYMAGRV